MKLVTVACSESGEIFMEFKFLSRKFVGAITLIAGLGSAVPAHADFFLLGTDAWELHADTSYRSNMPQNWEVILHSSTTTASREQQLLMV
jgi:hypothetical protein